jgi:membrane associated rhomboid family serine protease
MTEPQPTQPPDSDSAPPPRQPAFNIPAVVVAIIAICVGIHAIRAYVLNADQDALVILRFAFWPIRYTGGFSWDIYGLISPLSYSLLHGDIGHVAVNMIWLAAFGSPLALRLGATGFILFWIMTALAAVGLHFVLHPHDAVPLVGASGAISGMMGAAARFGFQIDRSGRKPAFVTDVLPVTTVLRSRTVVSFLVIWLGINLLMGFGFGMPGVDGQIAWEAHIGGMVAGFFGIVLFPARKAPNYN